MFFKQKTVAQHCHNLLFVFKFISIIVIIRLTTAVDYSDDKATDMCSAPLPSPLKMYHLLCEYMHILIFSGSSTVYYASMVLPYFVRLLCAEFRTGQKRPSPSDFESDKGQLG